MSNEAKKTFLGETDTNIVDNNIDTHNERASKVNIHDCNETKRKKKKKRIQFYHFTDFVLAKKKKKKKNEINSRALFRISLLLLRVWLIAVERRV